MVAITCLKHTEKVWGFDKCDHGCHLDFFASSPADTLKAELHNILNVFLVQNGWMNEVF